MWWSDWASNCVLSRLYLFCVRSVYCHLAPEWHTGWNSQWVERKPGPRERGSRQWAERKRLHNGLGYFGKWVHNRGSLAGPLAGRRLLQNILQKNQQATAAWLMLWWGRITSSVEWQGLIPGSTGVHANVPLGKGLYPKKAPVPVTTVCEWCQC